MRAPTALVLGFAFAVPALVFAPIFLAGDAAGDDSKSAAAKSADAGSRANTGKTYDPNNVTALSEYMETCVDGNAKYVGHDMAGAIESYKKAIALSPRNPLGHYFLGEAQLGAGSTAEAESEWKLALDSADDKNPSLKAHILFVIADLKERTKKWDEAKTAWAAYSDYASKHADAGAYPSTGASRQTVIDDMLRQDKLYEVVRQRIAAEKDGGAEQAAPAAPTKPSALPKK